MARLHRYRIGIPPELSEIRTQPWLSEVSLTCDPYHHRGPIFNCHNSCACVTPVPTVFNPPAIHKCSLFKHIELPLFTHVGKFTDNVHSPSAYLNRLCSCPM